MAIIIYLIDWLKFLKMLVSKDKKKSETDNVVMKEGEGT